MFFSNLINIIFYVNIKLLEKCVGFLKYDIKVLAYLYIFFLQGKLVILNVGLVKYLFYHFVLAEMTVSTYKFYPGNITNLLLPNKIITLIKIKVNNKINM